ncbi:uncharacterized protein M6B38_138545 [Iris pallida]|uniref:ZCF37 n=1 Tax=Iris pallida TaxID=29817 RepID=A0AAX6FFX9_IRIPA|nr:uncharacterized protein M6B38_138545 [Iris pallida]
MFCGTRSFSHVDDGSWAPSPRPKRSKLKKSLSVLDSRAKPNTNPYSAHGLDKFERLLAELDARKKSVLALKNGSSEDTVRFRYANTDDWIPIVIKRPHPSPPPPPPKKEEKKAAAAAPVAAAAEVEKLEAADGVASAAEDHRKVAEKRRPTRWEWSVQSWAVVVVVVLMCLVFGRAFAVCCATILWYVAPMMKCGESSDNLRRRRKKKYGGRLGSNLRVTSGCTSMKVKKMGDGSAAGNGIST